MSIIDSLSVSVSGMTAQRQRVNTISENLANANTTRTPQGGPYRRREVIFAAVANDRKFEDELRAQERFPGHCDPGQGGRYRSGYQTPDPQV